MRSKVGECKGKRVMSLLRKVWDGFGIEILVNVVLPYLIYVKAQAGIGRVHALMASSLPPIAWAAIQLVRKRRVDALSLLVISGIALSLIGFLGGGSVRFLQLREHLVSGVIGLVFLGSAAIQRPLIYEVARATVGRKSPAEAERFEQLRDKPQFRHVMMLMTLVWGFGLLVQTGVACLLIFEMPIREFLIVGPIVGYVFVGTLILWTFWYARQRKRRSAAAQDAQGQRVT